MGKGRPRLSLMKPSRNGPSPQPIRPCVEVTQGLRTTTEYQHSGQCESVIHKIIGLKKDMPTTACGYTQTHTHQPGYALSDSTHTHKHTHRHTHTNTHLFRGTHTNTHTHARTHTHIERPRLTHIHVMTTLGSFHPHRSFC